MTTYYVGPGGSDVANGLTWATRKVTLNGVEDIPVAAGDIVYVGAGVYRELLTIDVSGSSGSSITYVGDVTGEHTDGVGGPVRITGSDNDQTAARASCVVATAAARSYRTFRGLLFDGVSAALLDTTSAAQWILEDCVLGQGIGNNIVGWIVAGASQAANTMRRCLVWAPSGSSAVGVRFTHTATVDNTAHLIENCLFVGGGTNFAQAIVMARVGGGTIRNCLLWGWQSQIDVGTALTAGQTWAVNNCLLTGARFGLRATAIGEITEDYNLLHALDTARTNTSAGANSVTYPPLFGAPPLLSGLLLPWAAFGLSDWSQVRALADTGAATDDLHGRARPATSGKRSWGPFQWAPVSRETTTTDSGGVSLKLADAGRVQFIVPVTAVSTTISVKVYREANYAGTNPQMVIKQPGQSDRTTTDAGSSGAWNTLSDTFTPAANPSYIVLEVVSNNTAISGNYDVFFDTPSVS